MESIEGGISISRARTEAKGISFKAFLISCYLISLRVSLLGTILCFYQENMRFRRLSMACM
jgi:hypothetical protein